MIVLLLLLLYFFFLMMIREFIKDWYNYNSCFDTSSALFGESICYVINISIQCINLILGIRLASFLMALIRLQSCLGVWFWSMTKLIVIWKSFSKLDNWFSSKSIAMTSRMIRILVVRKYDSTQSVSFLFW